MSNVFVALFQKTLGASMCAFVSTLRSSSGPAKAGTVANEKAVIATAASEAQAARSARMNPSFSGKNSH